MQDLHVYLRDEFRRYFPDANISVHVTNGGETIDVGVRTMGGAHIRNYRMAVGSDDDWFEFTNDASGRILTVPLMPEELPDHGDWVESRAVRGPIFSGKEC